MKWMESIVVAFSMYSKIPMPHIEWNKDNMRYTLCFFPLVGAAVGLLLWLWGLAAWRLPMGNFFRAMVFVMIPILVTGGIHLDGLLDTADALSSWQTRERRLEILKDSHAGAFAIIVCCGYYLAAAGIWTESFFEAVPILALGCVLSRALSGFGISTFPCAKNTGLAAAFANAADKIRCRRILLLEAVICIAGMLAVNLRLGILAAVSALIVCLACRRMALRTFGGITGDIQGFFLQICELVMAFAVILGGKLWY